MAARARRLATRSRGLCSAPRAPSYTTSRDVTQSVPGLYIPSHRPAAVYTHVQNIPTDPVATQKHYRDYQNLLVQAFASGKFRNPGGIQKQSIISLALFGEGNNAVAANPEYERVFHELQEKLRVVLPYDLGFRRIEVRMPEVVLVTDTGDFSVDAMSGGINALFGIVWQIFMSGIDRQSYAVVIDEPENHLHPSMQRTLLPNLAKAFPDTRFIVATHSPFIVSSFPEAAIYALMQNDERRIESFLLESDEVSGTPNRILREILDVKSNLPVWVEDQIRAVLQQYAFLEPEERAEHIMAELSKLGISDALSDL